MATPAFNSGLVASEPSDDLPRTPAGSENRQPGLSHILCGCGQVNLGFHGSRFSLCKIKGLWDWTREPFL